MGIGGLQRSVEAQAVDEFILLVTAPEESFNKHLCDVHSITSESKAAQI